MKSAKRQVRGWKKQAEKVHPEEAWEFLDRIAHVLTFYGRGKAALQVWNYCYSGRVELTEYSVNGHGPASCVMACLGVEDNTGLRPSAKATNPSMSRKDALAAYDEWVRNDLCLDAWGANAKGSDFPGWINAYRKAIGLARPGTERLEKAVGKFEQILHESREEMFHHCHKDALVLLADMSIRLGNIEVADAWLRELYPISIETGGPSGGVPGLTTVTERLLAGVLADKLKMSEAELDTEVESILDAVTDRIEKYTKATPPTSHVIFPEHNQIYLEPEVGDPNAYDFTESELKAGFSSTGQQAVVFMPEDTWGCRVDVEQAKGPSDFQNTIGMLDFPLEVNATGRFYLRTVGEETKSRPFAVPPGKYRVYARFFEADKTEFRAAEEELLGEDVEDMPMAYFRLVLSFVAEETRQGPS